MTRLTGDGSPRLSRLGLCLIGEPRQQLLNLTRIVAQADPLAVQRLAACVATWVETAGRIDYHRFEPRWNARVIGRLLSRPLRWVQAGMTLRPSPHPGH